MNISVVIPAYNEEKRIKDSLLKILRYLKKKRYSFEIIFVDDGSTDNTVKIVRSINSNIRILKNKKNYGKGYSVKKGMKNAVYNLILFTDADLATPIEELDKLIKPINEGYDIAIASRNLPMSDLVVKQPFYRQILGKGFPLIVNFFFNLGIKDTQCGFKLFKAKAAKKIIRLQKNWGFSFDVELLYIAKKQGMRIKEVPARWIDKAGSKVSPIKDALKMFIDILKIKYNSAAGRYG